MVSNATYRARLRALKAVIARVPAKLIDLENVGIYPDQERAVHGPNFTAREVIECGTAGCVLGWARCLPALRQNLAKHGKDLRNWYHVGEYFGQFGTKGDAFFSVGNSTDQRRHKAEALRRIDRAITRLS